MLLTKRKLLAVMSEIVPLTCASLSEDTLLSSLGFSSLAMVALFVEVQREFAVPLDALVPHLHMACTFGSLATMCAGQAQQA